MYVRVSHRDGDDAPRSERGGGWAESVRSAFETASEGRSGPCQMRAWSASQWTKKAPRRQLVETRMTLLRIHWIEGEALVLALEDAAGAAIVSEIWVCESPVIWVCLLEP